MGAIAFTGNKLTVIAVDYDDAGEETSRLELPRVKSAEDLRTALAQYTAWLFMNHLAVTNDTPPPTAPGRTTLTLPGGQTLEVQPAVHVERPPNRAARRAVAK